MSVKPELMYNEHPFEALRYFEWRSIELLYAKTKGEKMYNLYPDVNFLVWQTAYGSFVESVKRKPRKRDAWVVADLAKVGLDKELDTLDKVYAHIEAQLKPIRRGEALKDDKRALGQREYQRQTLGSAFINNSALVSAAKTACKFIAAQGGLPEAVQALVDAEATKLEEAHCEEALNDDQRDNLRNTIMLPLVSDLMAVGVVERLLLGQKEKQAYFLWGHIKAKCIVGDEVELSQATYIDWCGGDSSAHKKSLEVLEKLDAISVHWGKKGVATRDATLVKRLL